jgi:fumarylacetoacetase
MTHASADDTLAPALTSWVESANDPAADFPIQNLPFGVFRLATGERRRIGIAIGEQILDLDACVHLGLFDSLDPAVRSACRSYTLNALLALGRADAGRVRALASRLLREHGSDAEKGKRHRSEILIPMSECVMTLPADIGDYTDFYASVDHATRVGAMFRPDSPLLPNYKWVPIGYHGRASSVVASGASVRRPHGQTRSSAPAPTVGPTRSLDYELEVGALIARGNEMGTPVPIDDAESRVFGLCLLNDWSARDIQSWEYQPLGPFLAKNFATSISPWVVTLDALEPFRVPRAVRPSGDPEPLPYLDGTHDRDRGAFDIQLEVWLRSARMRDTGVAAVRASRGSFATMYWTFAQMIAHHTSNGCNLRPGDLIASGTVSGPTPESRGCMLELTSRGAEPIELPTGERRAFLEDGDEVILRGWCERDGARRIGFGECRGEIRG